MISLIKKLFGSRNDREVRKFWPRVKQINELEAGLQKLSDDDLRAKTAAWKAELSQITDNAELALKLNEILPEAFAVVKNACRRLNDSKTDVIVREHPIRWEMIPFDVQLIGGIGLHNGKIAEMATGEGKTLVSTMPVYLNALTGRGVHVVTVNDYLAARDSEWMGAIYKFLGLTVGVILHDQPPSVRREQYNCDITYGTNAEFGFDYLRDNGMATRKEEQVQRGHYFAIVDEVDSILIDEARTPLIISGPAVHTFDEQYAQWKPLVDSLVRAQQGLCNRYLSEAEALIKKLNPTDGSNITNAAELEHEIGLLLFRVKTGQPKSEGLMKVLENPEYLKLMNQAELDLHKDQKKVDLYREKEELLFAIDEKSHEADLTEKGRNFVSPKDPDAFMLPDLNTMLHDVDAGDRNRRAQTAGGEDQDSGGVRGQSAEDSRHLAIAQSLQPLPARRGICRARKQGHHRGPAHGPADARPPLERRLAPGRRGEGRRADRTRDADAGDNHDSKLFPALHQARGHDRHGGNRGGGIFRHLQARRADRADQQAEHPQGHARFRL